MIIYLQRVLNASAIILPLFYFLCLKANGETGGSRGSGVVVTYPAPEGERVDGEYILTANGKKVDIYKAQDEFNGKEYFFAYFDCEGRVDMQVESPKHSFSNLKLLPDKFSAVQVGDKTLKFSADKPFKAIVAPDERNFPLIIFANPLEKDAPKSGSDNIIYYGAGVHSPDKPVVVKAGQTLYLAGGCVLKGSVFASGDGVSIRGRGIIDGGDIKRFGLGNDRNGVPLSLLKMEDGKNFYAEGIILRNSFAWTFVIDNCDEAEIKNVKICCSRMLNDDAFDICNSRNVLIEDCFARAQDDIIAVKGMDSSRLPCENLRIYNCMFWTDRANIFRIGYECSAPAMRNIAAENIYIPFYSFVYNKPEAYWANALIWLQPAIETTMENVSFKSIDVRSNGNDIITLMANPRILKYRDYKTAGRIRNCLLEDLRVNGKEEGFNGIIYIRGHDEAHDVDGITLKGIKYFGREINPFSKCVKVGEHTKNIKFTD